VVDKVERLNDVIALRVIPEIRQTRRMTQAILIWQIATIAVTLTGWTAAIIMLWWGMAHA
jgi:hypothetical protein